jgi:hypothetical protein
MFIQHISIDAFLYVNGIFTDLHTLPLTCVKNGFFEKFALEKKNTTDKNIWTVFIWEAAKISAKQRKLIHRQHSVKRFGEKR